MDENGLTLLKCEMASEETHLKVNAIHRLKTVILSVGQQDTVRHLIPYLLELADSEDDEVLFAIAEEIGSVFTILDDKTAFLPLLERLAWSSETVVREQAARSLIKICQLSSSASVKNDFVPLVLRLAQSESFTGRQSSCQLFKDCYTHAGEHKQKLRSKFRELCNEDMILIRRNCAIRLGEFVTQIEKEYVLTEILPVFRQLAQDEHDIIRVMCLDSLVPIAKQLSKQENQIHTLGVLLAAAEDKSWKVRLALAKKFSELAEAFGPEVTDNSLIQMLAQLLKDEEFEVRNSTVQHLSKIMEQISADKIIRVILPTLKTVLTDSTSQFRSDAATSLCQMAAVVGQDITFNQILPILNELLNDENSDVKLNVVQGMFQISKVVGLQHIKSITTKLSQMTNERNWRVSMAVFELIANLGIHFGEQAFVNSNMQSTFFGYLDNTAAAVRKMGIQKTGQLSKVFSKDWITHQLIPTVTRRYKTAQLSNNYRICCLQSIAEVMPQLTKPEVQEFILPVIVLALKDPIPNVRFCGSKMIEANRGSIDTASFNSQLEPLLQSQMRDADADVSFFARQALESS